MIVCPVPNGFQGFWILTQVWIFAVVNKATRCILREVLFKRQLLKWRWVLANVIVEAVGVVFLIRDVFNQTKLLFVIAAERIRQRLGWRRVDAEVVAFFFFPLGTQVMHFLDNRNRKIVGFFVMFPLWTVER